MNWTTPETEVNKNSGGTFYATPTQGHLPCKKQNQNVRITSKHTHAITHRKTKALIEGMRAMISYWLQHTQITTPSQNKKQKNTDRSINSHLSDSLMSSCEVAAEALSFQSHFFSWHSQTVKHTVHQLTVYTHGLSTDCMALIKRRVSPL